MTTPKTPVSMLNEYMFRAKQIPQFQLVVCSPAPDPSFSYEVTVDHVRAQGSGRSKKEAKHNAALNALKELAKSDERIQKELSTCCGLPAVQSVSNDSNSNAAPVAVSPYAEQVTENTVGDLATLCAQNRLPTPEYTIVEESGPPHCKTFRMHCTIHKLVGVGISRTKKQAKHISAKSMIDKLKEHLGKSATGTGDSDIINTSPLKPKNHSAAKKMYCTIKEKDRGSIIRENVNLNLATCHLNLKGLTGTQVEDLKAKRSLDDNPEDLLKRFADEQQVSLSFEFIKGQDSLEEKCLCTASLSTVPELVQIGFGKSEDVARELASVNLLKCLLVMLGD